MFKTTKSIVLFSAALAFVGLIVIFGGMFMGFHNKDVSFRNQISAKQTDNKNQMANMRAKFLQTGQVTQEQAKVLEDIFVKYAEARNGGSGQLFTMVTEAIPNVDVSLYKNLQNIIASGRDSWALRQTELIDYKREHDNLMDKFPGNVFAALLGRKKVDIVVVTSSETETIFENGKEDSLDIFPKGK